MPRFSVTYEIVTPESAEHGDVAERGYAMPGGWQYECPPGLCGPEFSVWARQHDLGLREALDMMGCCEGSDGTYYELDGREDYRTGAETRYAFHVPRNITPSSLDRLERLMKARGIL